MRLPRAVNNGKINVGKLMDIKDEVVTFTI